MQGGRNPKIPSLALEHFGLGASSFVWGAKTMEARRGKKMQDDKPHANVALNCYPDHDFSPATLIPYTAV